MRVTFAVLKYCGSISDHGFGLGNDDQAPAGVYTENCSEAGGYRKAGRHHYPFTSAERRKGEQAGNSTR
jgi:hypothetical protein